MLTLLMALMTSEAEACGGLFCNAAQPVDQAGERILFALIEGQIEVHVQISYQGPAEDFSWIVPTPAEPELLSSTDDLFFRLGMSTTPIYQPTIVDLGDCNSAIGSRGAPNVDMAASAGGPGEETFIPEEAGVTVVQELQIGPYDAQVLTANDAGVLVAWLEEHGYDLPEGGAEKIAPYVASGSYYIGLQLQKDREAGDLTPIAFRYAGTEPVIPLQLTAVAATDDMRLQPFVLGDARAVPENYMHVVVNDFAVDWLTAGSNYLDVVRRAADAAGGQAFVTDAASRVADLDVELWREDLYPLDEIRRLTDADQLAEHLMSIGYLSPLDNSWQHQRAIPVSNGTVPILARFVPSQQGESPFDRFTCLRCYVKPGQVPLDGAALADALEAEWVSVMRRGQELLDASTWLTRLTSSMSADEMTVDPRFVLNPDLPAVPGQRPAELEFDCRTVHNRNQAPRALVLPDGRRLELPSLDDASRIDFTWDSWVEGLTGLPAAIIEQTGRSGEPVVVTDHSAAIDAELGAVNAKLGCRCDTGAATWTAPALLALGLLRRRRR